MPGYENLKIHVYRFTNIFLFFPHTSPALKYLRVDTKS